MTECKMLRALTKRFGSDRDSVLVHLNGPGSDASAEY